jgi:hypothetical protein
MPTVTHIIDSNLPVYATGNQTISGIKTFTTLRLSGDIDPSESTLRIGDIFGISGKNVNFTIGNQSIVDNGLRMTIHSGSGDIGGAGGLGDSRAISFLRGSLVQGATSSYGIVFSGSSINIGGICGYLTRSSLPPQSRGAVALDQATLVWTDRILSGEWSTDKRLLVNGTGVLLSGEAVPPFVDINNIITNFSFNDSYNSKLLTINASQNITGTVPTGLSTGYNVSFAQMGTGKLFITGSNGAIVRQRLNLFTTAGQYGIASLLHHSGDQFLLYGDLV